MKDDTWGSGNTTRVNGQLPGDVRFINGASEQVMSVLDFCEKSRVHLVPDVSNEQKGFISHGPKGPTSQGPKGSIFQGSPSTNASLDKDEKDSPIKNREARADKDGAIFQAKANEKGKQIMGKGNLKKVTHVKGKINNEQTLTQMMEIGTKCLRGKEVSEEEDTQAQKRFCETIHSGLADSALEMATAGQCCREK